MKKTAVKRAIKYAGFASLHLEGVVEICRDEGWPSFPSDSETALRALTAPGVTTVVACENSRVVGFAYLQSDGAIQEHLSLIAVRPEYRRRGVARRLLEIGFASSGAKRIDLVSSEGAHDFYRSFQHHELPGFRIYPQSGAKTSRSETASDPATGARGESKAGR